MSIISDFADLLAGGARSRAIVVPDNFVPPKNSGIPITEFRYGSQAWNDLFGPHRGLPHLNEQSAATVTAIYACVNLIAGAIATLPFNLYSYNVQNGERDQLFNDDLIWMFNEEMSPRWPAPVGWEYLSKSLLFEGDGFAIIRRDRRTSAPIGLEPVHPRRVLNTIIPATGRMVYGIAPEILPNGEVLGGFVGYDQDDILHFPGFGFNGLRGMSPLRFSLRHAGAMALAMQEYSANFFANGARPDYALTTTSNLSAPKFKEIQEMIDERHRGAENAHRPMLLDNGLDVKALAISAEDMQLLSTRQFQIEEVARAYGVPPFMIGHNEKTTSWGSGIEAMSIGFVRYTLRQHLNKMEKEIGRKIFRKATKVGLFDTADLEQADTAVLATSLRTLVGRAGEPRVITPDEARAILKRKKKGGNADELGVNVGAAADAGANPEDPPTDPADPKSPQKGAS